MNLTDIIKTAMDQIQYIAKTETVIGEPIHAGNLTLIPVSRISVGFAAGGAGKDDKSGAGAGTGGGINITPLAFISIFDDKLQVHSVSKSDVGLGKILALAPDLIRKVAEFTGRGEKKDKDDDKKR